MNRFWILIVVGLALAVGAGALLSSPEPAPAEQPTEPAAAPADLGETPAKPEATEAVPVEENPVEVTPPGSDSDGTDPTPPDLREQLPPSRAEAEFSTDFSRHTFSYGEVLSGGPPKDGIPALDEPVFIRVNEADAWLQPEEPVIALQIAGEARAYPLQILTWHEIVNDEVGGIPVVVTFCPLCNTAIAFEREFDGQVLDFGTTGRLRFSNLIMYDRQTETWWQQATGDGLAGKYAGSRLTFLPAAIISWADFKEAFPESEVLSRETGFSRDYGRNPYAGYDNINNSPFLFQGPDNTDRLPAMARVLTVELDEHTVAYPNDLLAEMHVVNDSIGELSVVVFWEPGTASALDNGVIADGRDVGAASVYSRVFDGRELTFAFTGGQILDDQTGSVWNVLGEAVAGELEGSRLEPLVSVNHFWFSWAAFKPETRIYQGAD
jgi:hypothetical protein